MNRSYRTSKGTELPLLNLRGREYLEVKYRLVWFREEHPDWSIETEILAVTETSAYARATIKDETGRVIATSHKFETKQGFPDFIEKAETGAIGRALALIGFGTQFCADELDEGERIVDAPVDLGRPRANERREQPTIDLFPAGAEQGEGEAVLVGDGAEGTESEGTEDGQRPKSDPGDYRVSFGRKYKGKRLKEIPRRELESYVDWLESDAQKKGVPLSEEARFLKMAVGRYLFESSH